MSGLIGGGTNRAAEAAAAQAASAQRQQLAQLAKSQAEVDQAAASTNPRAKGRKLLTFLGADGAGKLGQA